MDPLLRFTFELFIFGMNRLMVADEPHRRRHEPYGSFPTRRCG
jgi:hypothetical protein